MGLNAVRVPFGYWLVLGPSNGDPYEGPAIEWVDRAVHWAAEAGLQVLLDLHGAPGGESADAPCGRRQRPTSRWHFSHWRTEESLRALEVLALRYKDCEHVTGIAVCNEPSNEIPSLELAQYYDKAMDTVRLAGMPANRVAVVLPVFQRSVPEFAETWRSVTCGRHENICFDVHYYHCFGDYFHGLSLAKQLRAVAENEEELRRFPCVVGEWSLALGRAATFGSVQEREAMIIFCQAQRAAYEQASHGWFFWTWKDGNGAEWDLRTCHQTGLLSDAPYPSLPEWSGEITDEDPLEEQLDPSPSNPFVYFGDNICLRAWHGGFVEATGSEVAARYNDEVGKENVFVIVPAGTVKMTPADRRVIRSGDAISLRSRSRSGRLLTVDAKGQVWANPAGPKEGRCQHFEVHGRTGSSELRHRSTVFFKSRTFGFVVDSDPIEDSLQARWQDFGQWQKFTLDIKHAQTLVGGQRVRAEASGISTPAREDEQTTKRLLEPITPQKTRDVRRRLRFKSSPFNECNDLCRDPSGAEVSSSL